MKHLALLHPYTYALASILFVYQGTSVIASPDQMVRPLLVLWLLLTCVTIIAFALLRDLYWSSMFTSIFMLGFCSHAIFFELAGSISLIVILLWYVTFRLLKQNIKKEQAGALLSVMAFLLGINIAVPFIRSWVDFPKLPTAPLHSLQELDRADELPDIYYIVLDGYGRADVLNELYDFDNSEVVRELETRGFFVPSESRSNYPKTALSVASTLNMDYVQSFAPDLKHESFWWIMSRYIKDSRVRANLESIGYQSIAITSDWGITNNYSVDVYYAPKKVVLSDYESYYLATSPLVIFSSFINRFAFFPNNDTHSDLILYNFSTLAEIASRPGPNFVFAHLLSPHPPFVFEADGTRRDPGYRLTFNDANDFPYSAQDYREGYTGQVEFINDQIILLVDTILEKSENPPIIILQADHGPGMFTDFTSADNTCLKERFSIFAAYYFPGRDSTAIPIDITPVNLFRIVFNLYFDAGLPLLESRYFYSRGVHIYAPQDVTLQVNTCQHN